MERVRYNPYLCNGSNKTQYHELNVSDEFKLIYHFVDPRFRGGMKIPFDRIDFEFEFYIDGREEIYLAKKSGELSQNCVLYPHDSSVKIIFENHGLSTGILMGKLTVYVYDPDMSDRRLTVSDTFDTGIKLI